MPDIAFDTTVPNVARMYDVMLGGKDNYASDREAVARLIRITPDAPQRAQWNRAFLGRAVRYVLDQGVTQFLDIGAGLPTQENVHQVAQAAAPAARTVYVDNDPVVLSHARALLSTSPGTAVIAGDVRDPAAILSDPQTREVLDFSKPVCLILVAVLHFVPCADDPPGIVAAFRAALAPGSYLIVSHVSADGAPEDELDRSGQGRAVEAIYDKATAPLILRDRAQIGALFNGFTLIEPGVVHVTKWRPDTDIDAFDSFICAVGRKD